MGFPIVVAVPAAAVIGAEDGLGAGWSLPTVQRKAVAAIAVCLGASRNRPVVIAAMAAVVATILLVVDPKVSRVSSAVALVMRSLGASGRFASPAVGGVLFGRPRCSASMSAGSVNTTVLLGARQERCLYDFPLVSAANR